MSRHVRKLTCEEFQSQLPELINSGSEPSEHPHAKTCANCRQIAQELESIADAARELFRPEWTGIKWWPR